MTSIVPLDATTAALQPLLVGRLSPALHAAVQQHRVAGFDFYLISAKDDVDDSIAAAAAQSTTAAATAAGATGTTADQLLRSYKKVRGIYSAPHPSRSP